MCRYKKEKSFFCTLSEKISGSYRIVFLGQKRLQRQKRVEWKVFWRIQKSVIWHPDILLQKRFLQKIYLASQINSPEKVLQKRKWVKYFWRVEGSEVSNWSAEAEKFSEVFSTSFLHVFLLWHLIWRYKKNITTALIMFLEDSRGTIRTEKT